MDASESSRLTEEEAKRVWIETAERRAGWIDTTIRRMGLPSASGPGRRYPRAGVIADLRSDIGLRDAIERQVETAFMKAVQERQVYGGASAVGFLYRLTQRRTWRLATPRALDLRSRVPAHGNFDPADSITSDEMPADERALRRQILVKLLREIQRRGPAERALLKIKSGELTYEELERRTGASEDALKASVSRLWTDVKERVLGEPAEKKPFKPRRRRAK